MSLGADDLRFFIRLVEAGGVSAAARHLHSSPPAVSRRLAALEVRLGVGLIERSSRRFVPTAEGMRLYERAISIVAEIDDIEAELNARQSAPHGHLRIGAPMEVGRRRIAPLLAAFQRLCPGVTCELVLSDAGQDPARDELDFAFRTILPDDTGLICRPLLKSRRIVCAAPSYLERYGMPETPEALARHDCLRLIRGRELFDNWRFQHQGKAFEVQVSGALSSTSGEVIHDWALAGQGLALKAEWDIAEDLSAHLLVECLQAFSVEDLCLYGVFLPRVRHRPALRAFINSIPEQF